MKENIFKKTKRVIEQFFETEYWYRFRKVNSTWYDEEKKKFIFTPERVSFTLTSTWNGENDLWGIFLLKLEHMIYNIKKYGVEKNYYFYASDIEKYGNKKDKDFIMSKALEQNDDIFVINGSNCRSDSGLVHFHLKKDIYNFYNLLAYYDEEIPQKDIKKKDRMYEASSIFVDGKFCRNPKPAKQYKTREIVNVDSWKSLDNVKKNLFTSIKKYSEENNIKIDIDNKSFENFIISGIDAGIYVNYEISDLPKFSKKLREHATGNFVKVRDMLHLRHIIKKIVAIDASNDKYDDMWMNIKDDNERHEKMLEALELFNKDRKELYNQAFELMYNKSANWWD